VIKIKKTLLILAKISISGLLIYLTLKSIGTSEFVSGIIQANPAYVIAGAVVFLVSYLIGATQWWLILKSNNIKIAWSRALSFYFIGLFFNNFLPSSLGGDVFRMIDIKQHGADSSAAVSTVFLDRFAGLFVMSGMAMLASPVIFLNQQISRQLQIFLICLPLVWILIFFVLFNKKLADFFFNIIDKFIPGKIKESIRKIHHNIYEFGRNPAFAVKILGIALCVQLCRITTIYLLSRSIGFHATPIYFLIFIPLIAIAAAAPISLGGLGVREKLGVFLFSTVTVDGQPAAIFLFMAYITAVLTSLPGGVLFSIRSLNPRGK